eukprot:14421622-Alexandrium_andersonii.AAC.1
MLEVVALCASLAFAAHDGEPWIRAQAGALLRTRAPRRDTAVLDWIVEELGLVAKEVDVACFPPGR